MATAQLALNSALIRKKWMREGLIQAASRSFFSPFTGNSRNSIVYQSINTNATEGHTVTFDYSGNLSGRARKNKEAAYGTGETKRQFSETLTVDRYRLVAGNGDAFDGVEAGNLALTQHSDSRNKLGDLFVRFKDQALFDSGQGNLLVGGAAQAPSHVIDLGVTFNFGTLTDIEKTLKTSQGYVGGMRRPPDPYMTADGRPVWLLIADAPMLAKLRQDVAGWQTIVSNADVRGSSNRLLQGVVGRVGNLLIVEAPSFFGATDGAVSGWGMNQSEVEISGLRQYSGATPATAIWSGQTGFNPVAPALHSRGLILGAGALQLAMGKQPDYKFQPSTDFGITSESAVEFWMGARKSNLTVEQTDYKQAKVANTDFGCIAVDLQLN